jgi:hypothetical protein
MDGQIFAANAQLRASGDVNGAEFDAAFELLAECANHLEPSKVVHVPRAPEEASTREENHCQQNRGTEPCSKGPAGLAHGQIVTESARSSRPQKDVGRPGKIL